MAQDFSNYRQKVFMSASVTPENTYKLLDIFFRTNLF